MPNPPPSGPSGTQRPRVILSWSSGKDSALALYRVLQEGRFEVVSLVTTITEGVGRVSMHGIREELVELQALSLGLPLQKIYLPFPCSDSIYSERLGANLEGWTKKDVHHIIFGDLYLEDIRRFREEKVVRGKMQCVFPLWGENTRALSRELASAGFKALITCVDTKRLPAKWVGQEYNENFLQALPSSVDPCGEKGEFHTFVTDGPNFRRSISVLPGERTGRQGFEFLDLVTPRKNKRGIKKTDEPLATHLRI